MRNGHFNPVVVAFPDAILGRDGGWLLSKDGNADLALDTRLSQLGINRLGPLSCQDVVIFRRTGPAGKGAQLTLGVLFHIGLDNGDSALGGLVQPGRSSNLVASLQSSS